MEDVYLVEGGLSSDDRGELSFVNNLELKVKRFYTVSNHQTGFVRAWHGHKNEEKYVSVIQGAALVGAVQIDDWDKPSKSLPVKTFVLSANKPALLMIPPGFANGLMTLTPGTKVLFLSSRSLEESLADDFRFDSRHWDPWNIQER